MEDFDSLNDKQLESLERGLSDLKNNRVMTSDEFWKELLSKKEQQELLDEVYENYCKEYSSLYYLEDKIEYGSSDYHHNIEDYSFEAYTQEEFIHRCKTDSEFSEKWGLTIEERALSLEERAQWLQDNTEWDLLVGNLDHDHIREVVEEEAPNKLIIVTYNDKKIKSYE
jgi:hypothetical protein